MFTHSSFIIIPTSQGEAMMGLNRFFQTIQRDEPEAVEAGEGEGLLVSVLIEGALEQFQEVTAEEIERLRLVHRLKVVQNLEDSQMKNVVRSVAGLGKLQDQELKALFIVIKNEQLLRCGRHAGDPTNQSKLDPTVPYYELYRSDQDTWAQVASLCSPWARSESWSLLVARMFKVMDTDQDGLISFRDVAALLDMMCGADMQRKLKLLYCLHLPGVVLPGEVEEAGEEATEVAADAQDFFTEAEISLGKTASFLRRGGSSDGGEDNDEGGGGGERASLHSIQGWLVSWNIGGK